MKLELIPPSWRRMTAAALLAGALLGAPAAAAREPAWVGAWAASQ